MSLLTLITPVVSAHLLSRQRLLRQRERAESRRLAQGLPHEVLYFHQVDDPYSHLAAQALQALELRYGLRISPHLVGPPADAAAPDRARLVAYSRVDAQRVALARGLAFEDPQVQPPERTVISTSLALLDAMEAGRFAQVASALGAALWSQTFDSPLQPASAQQLQRLKRALDQGQRLRARLGHYLGATFYYAGEWYWGVDRLYHLEKRLQALGASRRGASAPHAHAHLTDLPGALAHTSSLLFPPEPEVFPGQQLQGAPDIDFYFSLRSPYSAIVAPRVFELARRTGARVRLRYVLPMVMRGLAVPSDKRRYIALDAAREAHERGVPFGRLNDPVGRPTERGLSLMPWAERAGKAEAYVLAFLHGVWAQGIDAGSDAGLRRIVEQAGLPWLQARAQLQADGAAEGGWRRVAEAHRQELLALGLWGVPSFRVGDVAVWGQDRLGMVHAALCAPSPSAQEAQP
jgi:2-hydroxychromene-2-carboxylate isomerase